MTTPGSDSGPIERYLAAVRGALGPAQTDALLAEIQDHLLETTARGLSAGLSPELAEARAIELFGPAEIVARQYVAERAAAAMEKVMHTLRLVAAALALLTLYYARFFVAVRQEASTLIQMAILLVAAGVLALPARFTPPGRAWFRGGKPVTVQGWATPLIGLGLAVTAFLWFDHDAHSASDTLNRAVPTLGLILAVVLRIAYQQDERRLTQ